MYKTVENFEKKFSFKKKNIYLILIKVFQFYDKIHSKDVRFQENQSGAILFNHEVLNYSVNFFIFHFKINNVNLILSISIVLLYHKDIIVMF